MVQWYNGTRASVLDILLLVMVLRKRSIKSDKRIESWHKYREYMYIYGTELTLDLRIDKTKRTVPIVSRLELYR